MDITTQSNTFIWSNCSQAPTDATLFRRDISGADRRSHRDKYISRYGNFRGGTTPFDRLRVDTPKLSLSLKKRQAYPIAIISISGRRLTRDYFSDIT